MTTTNINCPKCLGIGLTGTVPPLQTCSECGGTGSISVNDASTLATINSSSQVPLEETVADEPTPAIVSDLADDSQA